MLKVARSVVEAAVLGQEPGETLPPELAAKPGFGMFVTLRRGKMLRACIGNFGAARTKTVGELLRYAASETAMNDSRFPSIHPRELPFLTVEISPMYDPHDVKESGEDRANAVTVGEHGLSITMGGQRGLLLPQVATENGWDEVTFLGQVCRKAGLAKDAWKNANAKLMTFRGRHFVSTPEPAELDVAELSASELQRLLVISDALLSNTSGQFRLSPFLLQSSKSPVGIVVETLNGLRATALMPSASIPDLLKTAAANIIEDARRQGIEIQPTQRIRLLSHAIALQPKDYPSRFGMLGRSALIAQRGDQFALQLPQEDMGDSLANVLKSTGFTLAQWTASEVEMLAFQIREIRRAPHEVGFASTPVPPGVRPAAVAGTFYPGNEVDMNKQLDAFFASKTESEPGPFRAIMLPHAGWPYCGDIIAETLQRVTIPNLVVVIGPKHRQEGANWSVSAAQKWQIPGARIPLDEEAADFLCSKVNLLRREDEAHRKEHGCEVLLPFLHRKNPELRIVPIAIGAADFDLLDELGDALRLLREERGGDLLFVISSDLNHFATEEENRRLDEMALAQLRAVDPKGLYDVCLENRISMCGMRPAVAVLKSLLNEEGQTCGVEITRYDTSARVTKDTSSVVGYAGALIS